MVLFAVLMAAALAMLGWGIYESGSAIAAIVVGMILLIVAIFVFVDYANRGRNVDADSQ